MMIRRPPSSTLFPTRRSSDLVVGADRHPAVALGQPDEQRGALDGRLDARGREAAAGGVDVETPVEGAALRSEEHTSELQSRLHLVCRLLLEKKKNKTATSRKT